MPEFLDRWRCEECHSEWVSVGGGQCFRCGNRTREPSMQVVLIPVLVYGTLRVGQSNYEWSKGAVVRYMQDCTTAGALYFVHGTKGFPVANFDEEGIIHGDLLWYDPEHPSFRAVVNMEINAGYVVRDIEVADPDGNFHEAVGFHYAYPTHGVQIESGDWVKESRWVDLSESI